ncbi:MAG: hypothetical protein ACYC61_28530 [Isosphaeraceae bacterium]
MSHGPSAGERESSPHRLPPPPGPGLTLGFVILALAFGAVSVACVLAGLGPAPDGRRLAASYLVGLMFVTTVSIGSLAWIQFHHLTGAVWSVVLRRLMENLTRPLPLVAVLFVPVALNLVRIYAWADPSRVAADPALTRKAVWLNPTFFNIRAAVYLAAWTLIAWRLSRISARQDHNGDRSEGRRMRTTSAWGLLVLGHTASLAAFDWLMSIDPHWTSTIFGVYFWAGSILSSLAMLTLLTIGACSAGWLGEAVSVEHLHDLGKLLFGFVIFWAYIAFCQYFLIWYANFPEETRWYAIRRAGAWNAMSWSLVLGHFVVPFLLLLFRATKRSPFGLAFVAGWILVFHYIDLYWIIMPGIHRDASGPSWLDLSILMTLMATCGVVVARAAQVRPLIPIGDPRLAESMATQNP